MPTKAVKPGEDINENDRMIFCCRHPFFNIYNIYTYARDHVVPVQQLSQQRSGSVQKKFES